MLTAQSHSVSVQKLVYRKSCNIIKFQITMTFTSSSFIKKISSQSSQSSQSKQGIDLGGLFGGKINIGGLGGLFGSKIIGGLGGLLGGGLIGGKVIGGLFSKKSIKLTFEQLSPQFGTWDIYPNL